MHKELLWKWQIWLYLWAAGVAGGGFFIAYLINLFTGFKEKKLLQYATYVGVPFGFLGVLMLLFDLGKIERFWHLMVHFSFLSPMSIGSWILTAWILCGLFLLVAWRHERNPERARSRYRWTRLAEGLTFSLSLLLIAYTGVLLNSTSLPMWRSYFLPALFVVSACSTGFAGILIILVLKREAISHAMGQTSVLLSTLEAVALVLFLINVPSHIIIKGALSLAFWGGIVIFALFAPLWLKLWNLGQPKENPAMLFIAAWWILIGGIILRAVIVIGGQVAI